MINNKYLFPIIIFISSLIVYTITLNPTVSFTDNGELAGVAYTLGIAHPSGYPLFSMIGYLWSLLPLPWTVIYKLNLLSAVFVSISSVIFFLTIKLFLNNLIIVNRKEIAKGKKTSKSNYDISVKVSPLANSTIISILSLALTLTFSFSSLVWEQATAYEVYSLQFVLINLSLYYFLKSVILAENHKLNMVLSSIFVGLSFSNHLTTLLIIPAFLYLYFKRPGNKFDFSKKRIINLIYLILIVSCGFMIYLYLPIRSMNEPDFNWGYVHRSLDKFMYHIQGKQYQVWMFSGIEEAMTNLGKFLLNIPYNLGFLGILAVIAGVIRLRKSYKEIFNFLIIVLITCVLYSVNYSIHDIDVYFYLAIYSLLFIAGAGALYIAENFEKYKYTILLLPLINISINFNDNDKSDNYLVYDYTRSVVDNLGANAIIISSQWDYWISAFWYLQKVENYRPDIIVIDKELLRRTWYPHQLRKWYPSLFEKCDNSISLFENDLEKFESKQPPMTYPNIQANFESMLKCIIDQNITSRPVYVTFDYLNSGSDASPLTGYNIIPSGFAFKLEKIDASFKVNFDKVQIERMIKYPKDIKNHLEVGILETASLALVNMGRYAAVTGDKPMADSSFRLALKVFPKNELAEKGLIDLYKR